MAYSAKTFKIILYILGYKIMPCVVIGSALLSRNSIWLNGATHKSGWITSIVKYVVRKLLRIVVK